MRNDKRLIRQAYRHCARETRRAAKNFYFAFITLPRRKRAAIYAVYALLRRWDDIADSSLSVAEKRELLLRERETIARLYEDLGSDDPVMLAAQDAVRRYRIPQRYFHEVLEGIMLDLEKRRYRTFEELKEYCYGVASAVGLISLEIFGYHDPKAREHAIDLGIAMQLTNILRDVNEDLERDRIYLPLEELERFGYSEEELFARVVNENFKRLMRFQVARAREYFQNGLQLLRYLPPRSRPCPAVLAGIYQRLLRRIEARDYDVFSGHIGLSAEEKLWTALRYSAASLLG